MRLECKGHVWRAGGKLMEKIVSKEMKGTRPKGKTTPMMDGQCTRDDERPCSHEW
ncbi:Hypothetical protein CINCED_3A018235 [Cinara cedri]|uniref:Uncharacterized protein n=1 Tax=Cinara cedri TaxID=506608 RepID=A0A5E4N0U3_9HEMI|nr:Hypothetical protein CINCED_3A018235 [Cinara cedri]